MLKSEREHIAKVVALGCIPCWIMGYEDTPAACHHAKLYAGMKRDHMKVIGMCGDHHQHGNISRHGTPKEFAKKLGDDSKLLEIVESML